ncbi:MAG: outer membrane lipoprotein carrier protein LolA [Desulfobacterales bacterium]|nr:outer membrane lipoprotein carrier protein LolA [Desulfobacterales bacterium]
MATARSLLVLLIIVATLGAVPLYSQTVGGGPITLDQILDGIERRYDGKGFTASFFQESILKAMQITDTAEGRLTVKRPGKMRWEYTIPEVQSIITDGRSMWIHRPSDNQVMVGKAPEYFGGGKGAGFLSDIRQVRKSFTIQMQAAENKDYYRLKLIPVKPTSELADIVISAAKGTFQIDQVVTHNSYGDETRIVLSDYQFNIDPNDAQFTFSIPKGVDVVKMDQF